MGFDGKARLIHPASWTFRERGVLTFEAEARSWPAVRSAAFDEMQADGFQGVGGRLWTRRIVENLHVATGATRKTLQNWTAIAALPNGVI